MTAPNAGFTTRHALDQGQPELHRPSTSAQALADPDSIFHYYQQLIRLRKANPVIVYGRYDLLLADHEQIYAFTRTLEDERLLVILNFTGSRLCSSCPPASVLLGRPAHQQLPGRSRRGYFASSPCVLMRHASTGLITLSWT